MPTIINSNGSKWAGEEPDTIDKLIEVLAIETIEEYFFKSFSKKTEDGIVWYQFCPIDKTEDEKRSYFFGNFEKLSHVFSIESDEVEVIEKLSNAIKSNKGWEKYWYKNLAPNSEFKNDKEPEVLYQTSLNL